MEFDAIYINSIPEMKIPVQDLSGILFPPQSCTVLFTVPVLTRLRLAYIIYDQIYLRKP